MAKKQVISLGLDLSLTRSGVVVLNGKEILYRKIIKSKPSGDLPINELMRLNKIVLEIENIIKGYVIDLAVIENLAFMAKGTSLTQLAGLSFFTRKVLTEFKIPFILCAPTTLKKFITGSGKAEKDHMMMNVYRDYNFESFDNNEADAYSLAIIGQALLNNPVKKLNKTQEEVLTLMQKQL